MGCLFSNQSIQKGSQVNINNLHLIDQKKNNQLKPKSWEIRQKIDIRDFQFKDQTNQLLIKLPGQINGQQFIIENCINCEIYIFDHTSSVFVDDCKNCTIYIGPCQSSVFIRDSIKNKVIAACQQFRTRDCHDLDILLFCQSQPVLESSSQIRLGCFQVYYKDLSEQLKKSGLQIWNNSWQNVHDFTDNPLSPNYSFFDHQICLSDLIKPFVYQSIIIESIEDVAQERNQSDQTSFQQIKLDHEILQDLNKFLKQDINLQRQQLVIPLSIGDANFKGKSIGILLVVQNAETQCQLAQQLNQNNEGIFLLKSRQINCQKNVIKFLLDPFDYKLNNTKLINQDLVLMILGTHQNEFKNIDQILKNQDYLIFQEQSYLNQFKSIFQQQFKDEK